MEYITRRVGLIAVTMIAAFYIVLYMSYSDTVGMAAAVTIAQNKINLIMLVFLFIALIAVAMYYVYHEINKA